jgi:hypothetical protein
MSMTQGLIRSDVNNIADIRQNVNGNAIRHLIQPDNGQLTYTAAVPSRAEIPPGVRGRLSAQPAGS